VTARIRSFEAGDADAVVELWHECDLTRPWNDPLKDIERKLTVQPDLFLVIDDGDGDGYARDGNNGDGRIIASAMIGFDGHRGWVSYLAVSPNRRGEGHARTLMAEGERLLIELGCPKIMLMVRADNDAVIGMYEHLDYAREETLLLGKRLIPDL
jgi:ribosomal protein S18 acetylase RimI-like enzyme